jgi:hypothetical protein
VRTRRDDNVNGPVQTILGKVVGVDSIPVNTDAVAEWALRGVESGNPPVWDRFWEMADEDWQQEVAELREQREMRYDDATLMLLKVVDQGIEIGSPEVDSTSEFAIDTEARPAEDESAAEDWKEKLKSASEQVTDQIDKASDRLSVGWKKWKQKAVEKYRKKSESDEE